MLGEAEALLARAKAKAKAIETVAKALEKEHGPNAVSITLAEQYISAFSELAKQGNTIILPSNTGDVTGMVAQVRASIEAIWFILHVRKLRKLYIQFFF